MDQQGWFPGKIFQAQESAGGIREGEGREGVATAKDSGVPLTFQPSLLEEQGSSSLHQEVKARESGDGNQR